MTADGRLEFLGRTDFLVKIRGYRIQLEEVEAALAALPTVRNAVVVAQSLLSGEKRLVAYIVPWTRPGPSTSELRQALRERLPTYMIPAVFQMLDALPLNAGGKVNRQALPPPGRERPTLDAAFVAPRMAIETQLAALWAELLELHPVGVYDNFFDLGGHSILIMHLIHQIEQQFNQKVVLREFMFEPTIAHLATLLSDGQAGTAVGLQAGTQPAPQGGSDPTISANAELCLLYDALADREKIGRLRSNASPKVAHPRFLRHLMRLPHPLAMQLLDWAMQQGWVQRGYFPSQTALVQQFLAEVQPPPQKNSVARSLFFGCLTHFGIRRALFQHIQRECTIPVEGLELLEAARTQRQGVILLTSHNYQNPYFRSLKLTQRGIGTLEPLLQQGTFDKVTAERILYTRQLELVRETLQQSGVIGTAPDANLGHGTQITVPFHGRLHRFRTSFAELALLTHAQVFFVASDLLRYNQFSFRLVGPFDMGQAAMSDAERVQWLMEQYVTQLRAQWARSPWAVTWGQMAKHLAYPPVEVGKSEVYQS
jgi:aryl carrier-like protein